MTSQNLAATLEGFLCGSNNAVVIEDGAVTFDLGQAKYSVSGETNKCLLHLWSQERNVVRRVLDVETKGETLRVTVQRLARRALLSSIYAASEIHVPALRNAPRGFVTNACWIESCESTFLNQAWRSSALRWT